MYASCHQVASWYSRGMAPYWGLSIDLCCWHTGYLVAAVVKPAFISEMHVGSMRSLHCCHLGQLVRVSLWQHCGNQWWKLVDVNWLTNFVWWVLTNTYTHKSLYFMPTATCPFTWLNLNLLILDFPIFFLAEPWPAVQAIQCYLCIHIYPHLGSLLFPTEKVSDEVQFPKLFPLEGFCLTIII